MIHKLWINAIAMVCFVGGAALGSASAQSAGSDGGHPLAAPAPELVQGLPDFTMLVQAVSPSVVNIRTMERVQSARNSMGEVPPEMQDFFEFFFDSPVPRSHPRVRPNPRRQPDSESEGIGEDYRLRPSGVGSGFIISADGYIMTNAHVVLDAQEIIVTMADQREYRAKVVGSDKRTDVALIKIDGPHNLPAVRIGNADLLKVGEWVVAIGSPFGLESSVTAGIVSAKQRDTGQYVSFIQTDVAINPGNSGGPLINMRGEVVGINSQIYSRSGGFMGISFSIPIDEAMRVVEQLRDNGFVVRGRIGVAIMPVTNELAQALGLGDQTYGALVNSVDADGPSVQAGILPGDVITHVNEQRVDRYSDLPRMVGHLKPGESAQIKLFRRGEWKTVTVKIDAVPSEGAQNGSSNTRELPAAPARMNRLGITVVDLTSEEKQALQVTSGVVVKSSNTAATRAGLREGDVILFIGNTEVHSVDQFNQLVSKLDVKENAVLMVARGKLVMYVLIKPAN